MLGKHMNNNIKDLKLFEGLTPKEIPYSTIDGDGVLNIYIPNEVNDLPSEYDQLTDEITGDVIIDNNQSLSNISGFINLTNIGGGLYIQYNEQIKSINDFPNLIRVNSYFNVIDNPSLTEIAGFDNLKSVGMGLYIKYNPSLTTITGFDNLISIKCGLYIRDNASLTEITGLNNLTSVGWGLYIYNNPKLVTMSIPGNLVRAVDYNDGYYVAYDNDLEFKSPSEFINSPEIMDDLVTRFNPGEHGDVVIKQIIENVEEWGTEETKTKVYSFLGKYMTPEQIKLAPTHIQHHYHPDYQGTTGRDVAKVNSGEVYGMF